LALSNRVVPPSASALIASLRGVGYSLETATADLIDNSIAAGAKTVDVQFDWNDGEPVAWIQDDGAGMPEDQLVEAMRFGGIGPNATRALSDLGRFGLGLKTASLSQCRRLTVVSKSNGRLAAFTWDIDRIKKGGDRWDLLEGPDGLGKELLAKLERQKTGTLVAWRKIDFGRKEDKPDYHSFLADIERVDRHLGMVFHRFLGGDARNIKININGHQVVAWDPFLETHEATIRSPEQPIRSHGGMVRVRGFVLPHRDRFTNEDEFERAGGPEGWNSQQGFYVYRQKRLLSAGAWLGLGKGRAWTREETSRLARIRIDIPNTVDEDWRIDIRKAIARPPDAIRRRLQIIADDIRRKAREVFVHRGQYGGRAQKSQVSRIWLVNQDAQRRYAIQRDHELLALVRKQLKNSGREVLEGLLELIERTVPVDRVWLDVTEHGVPPPAETDVDELTRSALALVKVMAKMGMSVEAAIAKVTAMDPFDQVKNLGRHLAANFQKVAR
jgi:Histidine kinase-, DNA gyrase B-, and HSP90-like ATPase